MPLKGINVVGTGDCMHPQWRKKLEQCLMEDGDGIFKHEMSSDISYILQTEIIFTADVGSSRKGVHTVMLFPSFESIDLAMKKMKSWGMKNTVGRPFLKCEGPKDVGKKMSYIRSIDDGIEFIPAHVLTPEGVFGSKAPIDSLFDFYGEAAEDIRIIETGLSADPIILSLIPEFDNMSLISNSDAHSPALNRMGREFTTVECDRDYSSILRCLRNNMILGTAEFNPVEGRYFLTGHRAGRSGHEDHYCVFSPSKTPRNRKCPFCGKNLTVGVYERALELSEIQGDPRTLDDSKVSVPFVHMVPLVEIIAYSLGICSVSSKKVLDRYYRITSKVNECDLWFKTPKGILKELEGIVEYKIINNILSVRNDNFCFEPPGYDGVYGNLIIGKRIDYDDVEIIN
jgi:PHP family Zn ribbon phosphoesterase